MYQRQHKSSGTRDENVKTKDKRRWSAEDADGSVAPGKQRYKTKRGPRHFILEVTETLTWKRDLADAEPIVRIHVYTYRYATEKAREQARKAYENNGREWYNKLGPKRTVTFIERQDGPDAPAEYHPEAAKPFDGEP